MGQHNTPARVRWARLRFSIIGGLLASPPEVGELGKSFIKLSEAHWRHPTTGEACHFDDKTIERWYYLAFGQDDPLRALERKVPKHAGTHPSVSAGLAEALVQQYSDHCRWSYQLHYDNLCALVKKTPALGPMPAYASVRRYMKDQGLFPQKKKRHRPEGEGGLVPRETRSFEVEHVHGLWHLDFHDGSRKVLCPSGEWRTPVLLGTLDDASRLCCHVQWYLDNDTEALVHGLSQAIQKRGLPRALLTDNGGPMIAAETTEGLERLGIVHHTTLPRTPQQNGKQEVLWAQIEGRLLAMLEGEKALTLRLLNEATQAWVEQEYHRTVHRELRQSPLERYLRGPTVGRESPSSEALRRAFRMELTRTQRRSDGTVTAEGIRFEIPSAYRTLDKVRLRVARWDLSQADLVDPRTGAHLATLLPLDKAKNADRVRRALAPVTPALPRPRPVGIAPHLRALMADYAATGLPPGYLPTAEHDASRGNNGAVDNGNDDASPHDSTPELPEDFT
jgi:putative transposase